MRVARLFAVILALTAATLSAAPHKPAHKAHKGGSSIRLKAAGGYWFYCYSDPGTVYDCDGEACDCRAACEAYCGGPCDWDSSCIY